jgi:hypothetical protein
LHSGCRDAKKRAVYGRQAGRFANQPVAPQAANVGQSAGNALKGSSNRVVTTAFHKLLVLAVVLAALGVRDARAHPQMVLHLVRQGQTVASIARLYRVTVARLCADNAQACRRPLRPGTELRIAAAEPPPSQPGPRAPRDPYALRPRHPGYVTLHSPFGSWSGAALARDGKVANAASGGFQKMLACRRTGKTWTIDERLIRMVSMVSDHFGGRAIRVVSGFRPWSPDQYTTESKHNVGRAMDFSIPGVPNEVVRDFCRSLPDVGCGYYPNSSFVHLDVREESAYWIDYSGPGEAPRYPHGAAPEPPNSDPGTADETQPTTRKAPSAPARATRPSGSSPVLSSASR